MLMYIMYTLTWVLYYDTCICVYILNTYTYFLSYLIHTYIYTTGILEKRLITTHENSINLCAAIGKFNLTDYGVSESIASTMDLAVQVAIIAGLEALKMSGIVSGIGGYTYIYMYIYIHICTVIVQL